MSRSVFSFRHAHTVPNKDAAPTPAWAHLFVSGILVLFTYAVRRTSKEKKNSARLVCFSARSPRSVRSSVLRLFFRFVFFFFFVPSNRNVVRTVYETPGRVSRPVVAVARYRNVYCVNTVRTDWYKPPTECETRGTRIKTLYVTWFHDNSWKTITRGRRVSCVIYVRVYLFTTNIWTAPGDLRVGSTTTSLRYWHARTRSVRGAPLIGHITAYCTRARSRSPIALNTEISLRFHPVLFPVKPERKSCSTERLLDHVLHSNVRSRHRRVNPSVFRTPSPGSLFLTRRIFCFSFLFGFFFARRRVVRLWN